MNKYINHFFLRLSCLMLFTGPLIFFPVAGQAGIQNDVWTTDVAFNAGFNFQPVNFLLAEAERPVENTGEEHTQGELVIPGEEDVSEPKKCMTVCKQWGEDCVIDPRTGGRKCRRACKRFGEECF